MDEPAHWLGGRVAVVTGASRGIGAATAAAIAAAGARVVLAARDRAALDDVASDIRRAGGSAISVPTDVSQGADVQRLFAAAEGVTALVCAAGVLTPAPFAETTTAIWEETLGVNLTGSFLCAQAAFRQMKNQDPRGGRIINNGSVSAHVPRPFAAAYTASKHAITGLTRAISLEGRPYRIACGQIDIGNAATDMTRQLEVGALQPDGLIVSEPTMSVDAVADAILYMVELPLSANVLSMTVMASGMPYVGRG